MDHGDGVSGPFLSLDRFFHEHPAFYATYRKMDVRDHYLYSDKFTIKGTSGYMAPEVVLGGSPDHKSDRFSFAVYIYRLLIGGFPFEGPYTEEYCRENDILPDDARKVIFGTDPVFVF